MPASDDKNPPEGKTLTLLRHAKSSWEHTSLPDRRRPLNARGRRDAPRMGKRLGEAGIRPSLIASSPAVRAWETAKAVAEAIGYPLEFLQREDDLYLADVETLYEVVARQDDEFNNLVICGHNPGLTDFANGLVPGITPNLPTSAFLCVFAEIESWRYLEDAEPALVAYDYPKKTGEPGVGGAPPA